MNHSIRPLIAGNWKMNGVEAALGELATLVGAISATPPECDLTVCVPATLVNRAAQTTAASAVSIGGQDCHAKPSGAHTGDISAEMLADAGAAFVIVGHSERRADHAETDADVRAKAEAALRAGLTPIICVGETEAERRSGGALAVVRAQLAGSLPDIGSGARIVVAYEPVWAIGTGLTPTGDDIAEMHAEIRKRLQDRMGKSGEEIAILYGGSLKPGNAAEILAIEHVNGGLVGGASLKADDFIAIVRAA